MTRIEHIVFILFMVVSQSAFRYFTMQLPFVKIPREFPTKHGHFRYFLNCSIKKSDFFAFFIKLITYFCSIPFLKAHSQSN